ncbi:MAG: hypothetical protein K2L42_03500 [Clostridia bacterium]|nr:hypothetical protein [Clostridia bacterium]
MNVFKAVLTAALITLISVSAAFAAPASAESARYAYAGLNSTVYICSEKSAESALFIIPQTYCVEILSEEDGWYRVKYAEDNGAYRAVYGYCRKSGLVTVKEPLENLYLDLSLKVVYKAESTGNLFPPLEIELTAAYYGAYALGDSVLSYVYCGEKFGYITQTVESYPLNELPEPTVAEVPETPDGNSAMLITAIVITLIAAIAIIVIYISSKKKPL